jgi:hypothetical protein
LGYVGVAQAVTPKRHNLLPPLKVDRESASVTSDAAVVSNLLPLLEIDRERE